MTDSEDFYDTFETIVGEAEMIAQCSRSVLRIYGQDQSCGTLDDFPESMPDHEDMDGLLGWANRLIDFRLSQFDEVRARCIREIRKHGGRVAE